MRLCGCPNDNLEKQTQISQSLRTLREGDFVDDNRIIMVDVVFHICTTNKPADTSDIEADVAHTIEQLNQDYSNQATNKNAGDGLYSGELAKVYQDYESRYVDTRIRFRTKDIVYKKIPAVIGTNTALFDAQIKKASPAVEPTKCLNFWVADMMGGLLGYAQFPWDLDEAPQYDGVVINSQTFGRNPQIADYNQGKTGTHENGHWAGLYHVFQATFDYEGGDFDYRDGTAEEELEEKRGDCVVDTPPQGDPTQGNPFTDPTSWPKSKTDYAPSKVYNMFTNYMDYSNDICLHGFTKDQAIKMRMCFYKYRPEIWAASAPDTTEPTPEEPEPEPTPEEPATPEVPEDPEPEPQPQPQPTQLPDIVYDFELRDIFGWVGSLELLGNTWTSRNNASVIRGHAYSGTRCLQVNRYGRGKLNIDLSGIRKATLSFMYHAPYPGACVWIKPPGEPGTWLKCMLPKNNKYEEATIELPPPFDSVGRDVYSFLFGAAPYHRQSAYYDMVRIKRST